VDRSQAASGSPAAVQGVITDDACAAIARATAQVGRPRFAQAVLSDLQWRARRVRCVSVFTLRRAPASSAYPGSHARPGRRQCVAARQARRGAVG
jgi:hypothetical protein